jgi:hypothetical protein
MGIDLDWQFSEDAGDELEWKSLEGTPRPSFRPLPAYSGLERHPELMCLVVRSDAAGRRDPGIFYLKMSFLVVGFLLAMYIFV